MSDKNYRPVLHSSWGKLYSTGISCPSVLSELQLVIPISHYPRVSHFWSANRSSHKQL